MLHAKIRSSTAHKHHSSRTAQNGPSASSTQVSRHRRGRCLVMRSDVPRRCDMVRVYGSKLEWQCSIALRRLRVLLRWRKHQNKRTQRWENEGLCWSFADACRWDRARYGSQAGCWGHIPHNTGMLRVPPMWPRLSGGTPSCARRRNTPGRRARPPERQISLVVFTKS